MKKTAIAFCAAAALSMGMLGCSSAPADDAAGSQGTAKPAPQEAPAQEPQKAKDFDGAGLSDMGEGTMMLRTAAGTTEGGAVPVIANPGANAVMSIELDYDDGDGSLCTVYVDGMECGNQINAGRVQQSLVLEGEWLKPGVHTVEVVAKDGDTVTIYKSAQYEVAE